MRSPSEDLIDTLRESIRWQESLIRDLEIGKAKVVPALGHVWTHWLKDEPAPPHVSTVSGELIPMITREQCTDFLKPWAFYLHIADCPKTGIRFIEGRGGGALMASDAERATKWLREQVENQRFSGDFRPDHRDSLSALLAQVRLETLREAQLAFKAAYSEQENPLLGTMYGLKAIAELEQASGTGK